MSLPSRTENQEDQLMLSRALNSLKEAHKSLKQYAEASSVIANPDLAKAVRKTSRRIKKLLRKSEDLKHLEAIE